MKVLRKKLKKASKVQRFFFNLILLIYILSFGYFVYGLLHLKGIETLIRIIVIIFFAIWFFIYFLTALLSIIAKKKKTFIIISIITLIWTPVFIVSSYYINKVYNSIGDMVHDKITYTTNLIALKENKFQGNSVIGMIESEEDTEGNYLAKKLIEKEKLSNKIETFEDYHSMINALYKGTIDACFVSSNYAIIFGDETFDSNDSEESLGERVKVLFEYSEELKNKDQITLNTSKKTKKITEPFTVLVMGVDSTIDGLKANQAFNGDTLILITFNPNTLTTTMFSIPRDLYVPIACNHNRYAKINSSAAYGSSCVINTVQQLTGIDIDYYVKINFTGVVKLVDALGGITVDIEVPDFNYNAGINCNGRVCEQNSLRQFGKELVYIDPGVQTINGEQALAYARCRHLYATSDIARNKHQQDLIEAMAQKLKNVRSIKDFENILDVVSSNIETNMQPDQILSFYNVGKDMLANSSEDSTALSIKKTHLTYYGLNVWNTASWMYTSALGYSTESLDAIVDLMKVNLGLKEEKPVKTFSISYNEDYTTPLVGEDKFGGPRLELMPSFIGHPESEIREWCTSHNITCTFEGNSKNWIIDQTAHAGELVLNINQIKFTYGEDYEENYEEEPEDEDEDEDDPSEEEETNDNKDNDKDKDKKDDDDIITPSPDDE